MCSEKNYLHTAVSLLANKDTAGDTDTTNQAAQLSLLLMVMISGLDS